MKHHGTTLLIGGKLHLAPITSTPQKVLDIGTGTGQCLTLSVLTCSQIDKFLQVYGLWNLVSDDDNTYEGSHADTFRS